MCGIIGYTGDGRREAGPILLAGLRRLEYRGYDSAGVALQSDGGLVTRKLAGRVAGLEALLDRRPLHGVTGIAHTRWATHGAPTPRNAHPHVDCRETLALVHNGIVENADALRAALERAGHTFRTETDTETLVHLIEDSPGDTLEARVISALENVVGTYGIAVISADEPGKIVVARQGSPVLLGIGENEYFVASDASAILEYTRSVVHLDDGDIAVLTPDGYHVIDRQAHVQLREVDDVTWDLDAIELNGYAHFMQKEIAEQPDTVRSTLRGRLVFDEGLARLNGLNLSAADCAAIRHITIVACGTSWHAGLVGRHLIESLAQIPVSVEYASEYRYRRLLASPGTLTIAISQSGETADTLEAMRVARAAGSRVVGIVNVVGSTIARESDGGIYLHAGPEIGVASTKAFTSQIVALGLLGLYLGSQHRLPLEERQELACRLAQLPSLVARTLELEPQVRVLAERFAEAPNALYLGRGVNFPVALEGALKLKELSYVHAEGYAAGELKHGPIALLDPHTPLVAIATRGATYDKVVSNIAEVRAREAPVVVVATEGDEEIARYAQDVLYVPETLEAMAPVIAILPLQLLAYEVAVARGTDVDQPRNLAKSVTVE